MEAGIEPIHSPGVRGESGENSSNHDLSHQSHDPYMELFPQIVVELLILPETLELVDSVFDCAWFL